MGACWGASSKNRKTEKTEQTKTKKQQQNELLFEFLEEVSRNACLNDGRLFLALVGRVLEQHMGSSSFEVRGVRKQSELTSLNLFFCLNSL